MLNQNKFTADKRLMTVSVHRGFMIGNINVLIKNCLKSKRQFKFTILSALIKTWRYIITWQMYVCIKMVQICLLCNLF